MKNGCPTVKRISLFLLLVGLLSINFISRRAGAQANITPAPKVSRDLIEKTRSVGRNQRIPVIVQFDGDADANFDLEVVRKGGRLGASLKRFKARALELTAESVGELAARPDVRFISLDRQTLPFGHVT